MQKGFNISYSIGKKTFQSIYQLSRFVGHPVHHCTLQILNLIEDINLNGFLKSFVNERLV